MKKLLSFTLAEVLIAMSIIGVIAAITIPSLNQDTADIENITRLKTTLSYLETAMGSAKEKYGEEVNLWVSGSQDSQLYTMAHRLMNYLNVKKDCGIQGGTTNDCFSPDSVQRLGGGTWDNKMYEEKCYAFIMDNDASVCVYIGGFVLDVDGPKRGYNTAGRDLFTTYFDTSGQFYNTIENNLITPESMTNEAISYCYNGSLKNVSSCTEWILDFDNMDYIKLNSSGKCQKTGVALSKDNPTCN